jgi:hypothetical protein
LFYILLYNKCYPTFDLAGLLFDIDRAQAHYWMHRLQLILSTRVKKIGVLFMDNTWTGSRCQKNKSAFIDMLMGVKADLFGIKADLFFLGKILGKPFCVGAQRRASQPP